MDLIKKVEQGTATEEEKLAVLRQLDAETDEYIALLRMQLDTLRHRQSAS